MRALRLFLLIIAGAVSSCAQQPIYQPKAVEGPFTLRIVIQNLHAEQGVLRIALYNDKKGWLSPSGMVRGRIVLAQSEEEHIDIAGLPAGRYALAVHQDSNGNNEMDKFLFFFPKEPYGFSNNVGKYGPASFSDAVFSLEHSKTIVVSMNRL